MDQRRVGLDVRAHDDDVARLEGRVVGKDVQERVAQHLDLAGAAVAGVDGEACVVRVERRAVVGVIRGGGVDPDVGLEASEKCLGLGELAVVVLIRVARVGGRENDLQLARVLAPGGEKAVARHGGGGVVSATRRLHGIVERRGDLLPEGGRRVQEVQVDVAMRGDRVEHLKPSGRQAREAEIARRSGRSASSGSSRRRSQATARRSGGLGTSRCARSRRHSSACQRASSGRPASSPAAHPASISGRCSA